MDRTGISLVVSWIALIGLFGGASLAAEPVRIVTLGDSITKGVRPGVTDQETFAAELQRQLLAGEFPAANVINVGIGGEMAGQGLKRLEGDVIAKKPNLVTIMYGHNDSYVDAGKTEARVPIPRFRADLSQLVQRLREANIVSILMTPPAYAEKSGPNGIGEHCNIKLALYAEVTRQVADTLQVPLIDHFAAWSETSRNGTDLNDWTTDGYHPNSKGHVEMAGRMLPVIIEGIPRKPAPNALVGNWPELKVTGAVAWRKFGVIQFTGIDKEAKEIRFPRLNNVVKEVTFHEPNRFPKPFKLSQSSTEWKIEIPKEATRMKGVYIELHVDGMPRLCETAAVSRPGADGVIVLSARDAVVHGEKLQFEPLTHKNTVGYWVNPKDYAEWSYALDVPGEFDVEVMQGCGGHAGSKVELGFHEGAVPFVVKETGHFQNFVWRRIGRITLTEMGVQTMTLKCKKLDKGAVMDMRQVRLIPVSVVPSEPCDMRDVEPDLVPPEIRLFPDAAPGIRFGTFKYASSGLQSPTYYLPTNWSMKEKWPILIELTGNGPYRNERGDVCSGTDVDAQLGYGLTGGFGAICLGLPYLNDDGSRVVTQWWGDAPLYDPAETVRSIKRAIAETCKEYNGDPSRVILVGFSRGSIAVNAVGLSTDYAANPWKAAVCYSHYDGVGNWPFPKSDAASAVERLKRLGNRPQYIISESPTAGPSLSDQAKEFIDKSGVTGDFTYATTGFINHNDQWALRPSPARTKLREWLAKQMQP